MRGLDSMPIKVALSLAVTLVGSLVIGGCGSLSGGSAAGQDESPTPESSTVSSASSPIAAPSRTPETAEPTGGSSRETLPAKPCDVVTPKDMSNLRMTKAREEGDIPWEKGCALSNTPEKAPPYHFRDLEISYRVAPPAIDDAMGYAKDDFARRKGTDFRQPNPFSGPPSVTGTLGQTGDSKAGKDFDEGYYVFYETAVAGAKEGNGLAVVRKGTVVISIRASGNDIPGQRVVDSQPIKNETAQQMIDAIADQVIQAVEPSS